jgi:hypothetical protein
MRRNLLSTGLILSLLAAVPAIGSTKGDMEFLGYSEEMMQDTMGIIETNGDIDSEDAKLDLDPVKTGEDEDLDEATALQKQLTELANSRSIRADLADRSLEIKSKIGNYWNKMNPNQGMPALSDELRSQILAGISEALTLNGYEIVQLELLDLPEGSNQDKLRAVVRTTRPLKTRNSYKEIQQNLAEIKAICTQAATIDGNAYLSELTTFVAENPKNKYYYEKTILKY